MSETPNTSPAQGLSLHGLMQALLRTGVLWLAIELALMPYLRGFDWIEVQAPEKAILAGFVLALGGVLALAWRFAPRLARRITGPGGDGIIVRGIDARAALHVALLVLGVIFLARGGIEVVHDLIRWGGSEYGYSMQDAHRRAALVAGALQAAVGLALLVAAPRLARLAERP